MRVRVNDVMIKAMAEVLQPQLPELVDKAMAALVAEVKAQTEDPLTILAVELAAGWAKKHGAEATQPLIERLTAALAGDGAGIATLKPDMTAKQLTALTDAYQSAEARERREVQRSMERLGNILAQMARYAGRAFLVSLGA